jgi:hypothetical protein
MGMYDRMIVEAIKEPAESVVAANGSDVAEALWDQYSSLLKRLWQPDGRLFVCILPSD